MARLTGLARAAAFVGMTAASASAQTATPPAFVSVHQSAKLIVGSITGTVTDERGAALAGAIVSALGPMSTAMATTDGHGHFMLGSLPPGEYALRVHLAGFLAGRRDAVRVGPATSTIDRIQLHRLGDAVLGAHPILTAGMVPVSDGGTSDEGDNHTETAWRLRHVKRSVLKQDGSVVSIEDAIAEQQLPPASPSIFGRAFDSAATVATSFFTATPFSGEVNLLTTSALGDGSPFTTDLLPRGIAYVTIGAPSAAGRWDVRASMSQSDLAAWVLAGSFSSRVAASHDYGFGVSYGAQQQAASARPLTLAPTQDDSRSVGEIYGSDRWTVTPVMALEYSGRYARYDYLEQRSLFSPRIGLDLTPFSDTHVLADVSQRMLAPGAEEFLAPSMAGPWLPPQRTFAGLDAEPLRPERSRMADLGVSHEFAGTYVIGIRHFQESVDDQMVTIFGVPVQGGPSSPGHYFVADAGGLDADGWAARLNSSPTERVHASIEYSVGHARWLSRGDMAAIAVWAPDAVRPQLENVHDLTTSVDTEIPETATHVFVLYKLNSAFARAGDPTPASIGSRFDVQVNQALPFTPFGNTRWEVLVGLRNVFFDPSDANSIYDELLVVRPPKRVLGGVLIKF